MRSVLVVRAKCFLLKHTVFRNLALFYQGEAVMTKYNHIALIGIRQNFILIESDTRTLMINCDSTCVIKYIYHGLLMSMISQAYLLLIMIISIWLDVSQSGDIQA